MVILSAAVQFALVVPSVLYFHRVPVTSILANLVSVPALNGAVGFGLTGLITGSKTLSNVAATLAGLAESAVGYFARIEPDWRPATPPLWIAIGFVLSLVLVSVALRHRARITAAAVLMSVVLGGWMCRYDGAPGRTGWLEFSTHRCRTRRQPAHRLSRGPDDARGRRRIPNLQRRIRAPHGYRRAGGLAYLWTRGLRRLDIVAMTHAHDDHAQGLSAVIRNFRPSEFWTGAVPAASSVFSRRLATTARSCDSRTRARSGSSVERRCACSPRQRTTSQAPQRRTTTRSSSKSPTETGDSF